MSNLKKIIYKTVINCLRMLWRIKGRRKIKAFGEDYYVIADTIFPNYRKFKLPKKVCKSEIVRYADYVQLHSVVNYVSQLKNQPTVIDIGAHHGAYAVILGKIIQNMGGRVIAVEPNPQSFDVLKQNIHLNELGTTVICEQLAIADRTGHMNIDLLGGDSKITSKESNNSCVVEVITLEQLLSKYNINHVHLMIIDVEGAELLVLRGFPWPLVTVEKLFCELHPYAWRDFDYNSKEFQKFLSENNFRCFDMYLNEHITFDLDAYIGPTLFVHKKS